MTAAIRSLGMGGGLGASRDEIRKSLFRRLFLAIGGGGGGIRTRDTIHHRIHTFQACAFNHSATPPRLGPPVNARRIREVRTAADTSEAAAAAQSAVAPRGIAS